MDIQELIKFVSETEKKNLKNHSTLINHYDIAPVNSVGSPLDDHSARPTIVFDVLDDEIAVKWLYLNVQNQGLGTRIIQWLIEFCKVNNISKISIRLVGEGNSCMIALAEKFAFKVIGLRNKSLDYGLVLKE